jgi:hypothetical protein
MSPLTMPPALLKAHQKLDPAVDAAYQPSGGKKNYASDAERVAFCLSCISGLLAYCLRQLPRKHAKFKSVEI